MDITTDDKIRTALVTGANKGLGLETSRRLAALGWTIWMAARDERRGTEAAEAVGKEFPEAVVRFVALDVTDDASVAAARTTVGEAGTGLDVLVNNAGVIGVHATSPETTPADFLATYGVNLLGPVRVTHAFLDLLTASAEPRLVMVSSGLGTIEHVNDPGRDEYAVPGMVYQSSKAALDMVANQYAKALPGVRVASVDPGYTKTDLNQNSGHQSVTEGTDAIVAAAASPSIPGLKFARADLVA